MPLRYPIGLVRRSGATPQLASFMHAAEKGRVSCRLRRGTVKRPVTRPPLERGAAVHHRAAAVEIEHQPAALDVDCRGSG